MTRLLVSVRDAREAQMALDAGVDLIDVKEPRNGSLGAAAPQAIAEIAELVAGRVPLSAALGELRDFSGGAGSERESRWRELPLEYAKLGLAGCADIPDWRRIWADAWRTLPAACGRIAVAYADWATSRTPHPHAIVEAAIETGCAGLLIDTFDKATGDLFAHLATDDIREIRHRTRQAGMLLVLAGGLAGASLRQAQSLRPDYVAVRGAVCAARRDGAIDRARLSEVVATIRRVQPAGH